MSFLETLTWRHAIKAFDKTKKVSEGDLQKVLTAMQMAPTSFGLQPFFVRVVTDEATRARLQAAGYNQDQFASSSHVLVLCRTNDVEKRIDDWVTAASGGKADARANFKGFEDMVRGALKYKTPAQLDEWTARQVYIVLGFGLAACAELHLDSCPMEGFDPAKFDEILGLGQHEHATVVLTIGYRNSAVAPLPKVRLPANVLFRR